MESLAELGSELTAIMEERKETLRADGKSERAFTFTDYPEAKEEESSKCNLETCFVCANLDTESWMYDKYNEDNVKRFDRKRWALWWRKVVLERYTDVALAPVKTGKGETTRKKFHHRRMMLHVHTIDLLIDIRKRQNSDTMLPFWSMEAAKQSIDRMMERRRQYELLFWESISFSAYFPKFANLDEDKRKLYNAENFFSERKRLTRSKLPLSLHSFGSFVQRLHTTPYAEEYRIPRRDFNGKWTAEPLKNEKGEARMHPNQGHRQNFMVELSKRIWTRFNEETPKLVMRSIALSQPQEKNKEVEDQPTWGPKEAMEASDAFFALTCFAAKAAKKEFGIIHPQ